MSDFMLPDGSITKSVDIYVGSWRALGSVFCKVLGGTLYAFDPDLALRLNTGECIDIPAKLAILLLENIHEIATQDVVNTINARKWNRFRYFDPNKTETK